MMTNNSKATPLSPLSTRLEKLKITSDANHIRFVNKKEGDGWEHDLWSITLYYDNRTLITDYKTGVGLRQMSSHCIRERGGYYYITLDKFVRSTEEAIKYKMLLVRLPSTADVFSSLLSDASCCIDQTFGQWCSDLGYSDDSIKAFNTYLACQKTHEQLIKFLSSKDLLQELSELEH